MGSFVCLTHQLYNMKVLASILLGLSLVLTVTSASPRDDLLCTVCIDIVTDIDSWLTSDTTEDQIVEWMFGFCEKLGDILSPDLVQVCEVVLGAELPNIIDNIVNNNLNPREVCQAIGSCPPSL